MTNQNPNAVNNGGSVFATVALSSIAVRAVSGARPVAKLSVGDLNGDGAADLAMGVSASSPLATEHGVILGQANSLTTQLNGGNFATASSSHTFKFNGDTGVISFAFADIDSDGDSDLLHYQDFAWSPSNTANTPVKIAVMEGDAAPDATTDQTLLPAQGYYGVSLVTADFNGDGFADLFSGSIISTFNGGPGVTATTASLAGYLGSSGGLATSPSLSGYTGITPTHGGDRQAHTLALGALDLNGDGYDDIVTNVSNQTQGVMGIAKITLGNSTGTFAQDLSSNTGGLLLTNFSFAGGNQTYRNIASGGDVNGDGLADMAGWSGGHRDILDPGTGSFVLFGNTGYAAGGSVDIATLNGTNGVKLTGVSSGIHSMALGDLNGDGLGEIVVGSTGMNSGAGKLWVVWGKQGGYATGSIDLSQDNPALFTTLTGAPSQGVGSALTIADIDGDGKNDLVIGSASGTVDVVSGETFEGMLTTPKPCYTTFEDQSLTLSAAMLLGNDSDPDGDPLTIQSVQGAVGGSVGFDQEGNIVFTPTANYNGAASFTYTISDGNGGTDTATVNLTVKSDEISLASVGVRAATNVGLLRTLATGDFNGDGVADIGVVTRTIGGSAQAGVIMGKVGSFTTELAGGSYAVEPTVSTKLVKTSLVDFNASFGDIDSDGTMDLIGAVSKGQMNVWKGDATPDMASDTSFTSPPSGHSGYGSVTADFNGDGLSDYFWGYRIDNMPGDGGANATSPSMAGWLGSSTGHSSSPNIAAYAGFAGVGQGSLEVGTTVAGAVDINGDGYDDIVAQAAARNDGQSAYGQVKLTFGNAAGIFESNLSSNTGGLILNNFYFAGGEQISPRIATGGDVNGDGLADMAGWGQVINTATPGNGTFVLFGNRSYAVGGSVDISTLNGSNGVRLMASGINAVALGDLNGDGLGDIVVGSETANSGAGKLWVVWGKEGGFSSGSIDLSAEATGQFITITGAASQGIGSALTIADIDGDGHNDLVVGSSSGTIDVIGRQAFPRHDVAPVAQGETLAGTEDQVLNITAQSLLVNDTDADGDTLSIASVGNAVGGTVVLNQDGSVTFTPDANYNGEASFDYAVSDGCSGTANATATINLAAVNDTPVVSVGSFTFIGAEQVSSQYQSDINNFINVLTDTHETAALPAQYRNGTGPITLDNQEREVIVHFHSEVAGNQSVIGFYVINNDGSFGPAQLVFPNASQTPPVLDPDDPNNPSDSYTSVSLGNLPAGASFGLFMISNGAGNSTTNALIQQVANGTAAFSFVNGSNSSLPASLFDTVPPQLMVHGLTSAPSTGTAINQSLTPIFHTAASANAHFNGQTVNTLSLNIDGMQHVAAGQGEINDGANTPAPDRIAIGWEDLVGGDFDFNDVILQVEVAEATLTQINPANIGAGANLTVTDVDQGDLQGAVFRISAGYVSGDSLQLSGAFSIDGNGDVLNNGVATGISVVGGGFGGDPGNPNGLSFTGTADQALYEQILRSITFSSSSGEIGIRTCEISVTDEASVTSNIAVQHVAVGAGSSQNAIAGTAANDSLTGTSGSDFIFGDAGNDTLAGGAANDILAGGNGDDTYIIGRGDGVDSISQADITDSSTSTDILRFSTGVAFDQLWFRQAGNDLRIDVIGEAASSVYLKDWYSDATRRVDSIETVDGSHSLSAANVANLVSAMASFSPPTAGQMTLAAAGLDDDLNTTLAANWA